MPPLAKHLANLNLFREPDSTVEITVASARGALLELGHKAGLHEPGRPIDTVNRLIIEAADRMRVRLGIAIPMVLHCPQCGEQHIDQPAPGWTNPPHRSHSCQKEGCGCVWRPSDLPTMGVAAIGTAGKSDTWPTDRSAREVTSNYAEPPTLPAYMPEEHCPGHAASDSDPKICKYCGIHIDSLRPLEPEEM